ncbi:MAG TPA: phytanoyl-CoA dioxygenase family protein [Gemmataceae bacterium]|nr:phytanoyl-CoA dioxygenase family protein [Gemmataceae bacterium]
MSLALAPINDDQIRAYDERGFVVIRGLFTPAEMVVARMEAERLLARKDLIDTRNLRCRWKPNEVTGESCQFECFDPVIDISPVCGYLARDDRLLAVLAELYREPACLFKDKLIFKPPGVKGYGMHQDYIAWPSFPRSFLTVLIPFDRADRDNGATEVFPGYHLAESLTPEDGEYHELPAGLVDESRGVLLELDPGDVAIFAGFTPHRSAPNRSERWRRQLYLSYSKLSDGGEQREQHYAEFRDWLVKKYAQYGKTETYFA